MSFTKRHIEQLQSKGISLNNTGDEDFQYEEWKQEQIALQMIEKEEAIERDSELSFTQRIMY